MRPARFSADEEVEIGFDEDGLNGASFEARGDLGCPRCGEVCCGVPDFGRRWIGWRRDGFCLAVTLISEKTLLACLGRLQFLKISLETLEATEIGKAVNSLRRHSSKQIQRLVKTLIDGWKVLADEWMKSRAAIAGKSNYQLHARQDVLTLPPLDAEALSKPALVPKKFSSKDVSEEQLMGTRLEIAKRKLHEGYQDAENAKKQRTIKVLEINDIPGKKKKQRKPDVMPPNNIRKILNGRR